MISNTNTILVHWKLGEHNTVKLCEVWFFLLIAVNNILLARTDFSLLKAKEEEETFSL